MLLDVQCPEWNGLWYRSSHLFVLNLEFPKQETCAAAQPTEEKDNRKETQCCKEELYTRAGSNSGFLVWPRWTQASISTVSKLAETQMQTFCLFRHSSVLFSCWKSAWIDFETFKICFSASVTTVFMRCCLKSLVHGGQQEFCKPAAAPLQGPMCGESEPAKCAYEDT